MYGDEIKPEISMKACKELALIIEDMHRKLQVPGLPASPCANRAEIMAWEKKLLQIWSNIQ